MNDQAHNTSLWRRIRHTPMRDWLRGRLSGCLDWDQHIRGSDLPTPIKQTVERVVKKTRLWRSEKADVADELLTHFADGLTSEQSTQALIYDFGDPTRAAKLIRRAKKRQRPFAWKAFIRSFQAVIVLLLIYTALTGWYALGQPQINTNYLAKLNAPAHSVPKGERAWPIYRKALVDHGLAALDWDKVDQVMYVQPNTAKQHLPNPDDPQWDTFVRFMREHQDALPLIRRGASKPNLGLNMWFSLRAYSLRDRRAFGGETDGAGEASIENHPQIIATRNKEWKSQAFIGVLLPHLHMMRNMAELTAADMHLAAVEGDATRALADLETLSGLASQAADKRSLLISQLVAQAIFHQACKRLADMLVNHPALLDNAQLIDVVHLMTRFDELEIRFTGERYMMYDVFQRIYDSSGNVTDEGLRFLQMLTSMTSDTTTAGVILAPVLPEASLPLSNILIANRKKMTAQYERLMAMTERYVEQPLWKQLRTQSQASGIVQHWKKSPWLSTRYFPLVQLLPALGHTGKAASRNLAIRDVLQVAIALELYHRAHGDYPDTLSALVPQYLPEPPVDHSTGKPLLYKVVDGKPLLYGRGLDGDDDGGKLAPATHQAEDGWWEPVPKQGDWVLFPRPKGR